MIPQNTQRPTFSPYYISVQQKEPINHLHKPPPALTRAPEPFSHQRETPASHELSPITAL